MLIQLNGTQKELTRASTLEGIITTFTKNPEHVIAEVNGHITKKASWAKTQVKDGDVIELVSFVGGG